MRNGKGKGKVWRQISGDGGEKTDTVLMGCRYPKNFLEKPNADCARICLGV